MPAAVNTIIRCTNLSKVPQLTQKHVTAPDQNAGVLMQVHTRKHERALGI